MEDSPRYCIEPTLSMTSYLHSLADEKYTGSRQANPATDHQTRPWIVNTLNRGHGFKTDRESTAPGKRRGTTHRY